MNSSGNPSAPLGLGLRLAGVIEEARRRYRRRRRRTLLLALILALVAGGLLVRNGLAGRPSSDSNVRQGASAALRHRSKAPAPPPKDPIAAAMQAYRRGQVVPPAQLTSTQLAHFAILRRSRTAADEMTAAQAQSVTGGFFRGRLAPIRRWPAAEPEARCSSCRVTVSSARGRQVPHSEEVVGQLVTSPRTGNRAP